MTKDEIQPSAIEIKSSDEQQVVDDLVPLDQLNSELTSIGPKEFEKNHPNPFLLLVGSPDRQEAWPPGIISIYTVKTDTGAPRVDLRSSKGAVEVKKSNRNPFQGRISIGRSGNNDLILHSSRISKLHAHLFMKDGRFHITDAGSRNGTIVNGEKLGASQTLPLVEGDILFLGKFVFVFLLPAGLMKLLTIKTPSSPG